MFFEQVPPKVRKRSILELPFLVVAVVVVASCVTPEPSVVDLQTLARNGSLDPIKGFTTDPNESNDEGQTPLHVAAARGRYNAALFLLSVGADPSAADENGLTPLHLAAENDEVEIVRLILGRIDAIEASKTPDGKTALHVATGAGATATAHVLVQSGFDLFAEDDTGTTPIGIALQDQAMLDAIIDPETVNTRQGEQEVPLIKAIRRGSLPIVNALLNRGADAETLSKSGIPPLTIALSDVTTLSDARIVAALISGGASPEAEEFRYLVEPIRSDNPNARDTAGKPVLIIAVDRDHDSFARYFVAEGADIDASDHIGRTALHAAAERGNNSLISAIVEAGGRLSSTDDKANTPLHYAVRSGDVDTIDLLIANGASPFPENTDGFSPFSEALADGVPLRPFFADDRVRAKSAAEQTLLHVAVASPEVDYDIVADIIDAGAAVNAQDVDGNTPLHIAISHGNERIVLTLLSAGASGFIENYAGVSPIVQAADQQPQLLRSVVMRYGDETFRDDEGNTIVHVMAEAGIDEMLRLLLDEGFEPNVTNDRGETPLHTAVTNGYHSTIESLLLAGARVDVRDNLGRTPLQASASSPRVSVFQRLLDAGSDINGRDVSGRTVLASVAASKRPVSVMFLLSRGADPNIADVRGRTPLHEAVEAEDYDTVSILIASGAYVSARDELGNTPLHLALQRNAPDITKELIHEGANLFSKNIVGDTPLHMILSDGAPSVREYISSALVNVENNEGDTPLHVAVRGAYPVDSVSALIEGGAFVDPRNRSGETPLHGAIVDNVSATRVLLSNGSDYHIRNNEGITPLMVAINAGTAAIAALLEIDPLDRVDTEGNSALHIAVLNATSETVELLVDAGFDPERENLSGETPRSLATRDGREDILAQF